MTDQQLIDKIDRIGRERPQNLMARHFDADYFRSLDESSRKRLTKIIASGVENPDSRMGAYAMNPEDYDLFAPMLDPISRDAH